MEASNQEPKREAGYKAVHIKVQEEGAQGRTQNGARRGKIWRKNWSGCSNKDAFPGVETCFDIFGITPLFDHKSPSLLRQPASASYLSYAPQEQEQEKTGSWYWVLARQELPEGGASIAGFDKTPQWRAGPMGPKTLCNACGVRYKSGRLLPEYRPANSPTFSAAVHSNSHRKVFGDEAAKDGRKGWDPE
nr:GATA transcription factor 1-like [Ipomoea batatas]